MEKKVIRKIFVAALVMSLFVLIAGCQAPPTTPDGQQDGGQTNGRSEQGLTKEEIESLLAQKDDVFKITWSPDEKMVIYIQQGQPAKQGMDEAYLWTVGQKEAKFVRDVSPTTHGFGWSPDSKYFIISEKLGDGAVNTIVKIDSLQELDFKPKSIGIPVWSHDSTAIAYGNESHEYGTSWGYLEVYKLGAEKSEYIFKARDYFYKVNSWDKEGNIAYTEMDLKGQETKKTVQNIRPSISGVHLGDTKEQVKAALGNNYKETPPSGEAGHFPEQVYEWDYDGYRVFIGAESGQVLEIYAESPQAETNLGIKMGDPASQVFEVYRPKYIEPESIHGGKLYGLFKVEGAAALFFHFDLKEGQTLEDIKPDNKVVRMILTYPEVLDDSF
ncbi:MAG: hypothetical protein ACOX3R_06840 [Desulfitobacteriia bacterium]|jgi:hypothetical protein